MSKAKAPNGQRLKATRSALAKLKAAGLFKGDVRSAKGGWRQQKLIKTYADVVSGAAKSVKVGKKDAKDFDASFRAKAGRVVVKAEKAEKLRYAKKRGVVTSFREEYDVKYKRIVTRKRVTSPQDIPHKSPKGKKWLYKLPHNPLYDHDGVVALLNKYKDRKGFSGFMEALEIYELDADYFPDEFGDELQ